MPGRGGQQQNSRAVAEQPSPSSPPSTNRHGTTTADDWRPVHQFGGQHSPADFFVDLLSVPHHHHHFRTTCLLTSSFQQFLCQEPDCVIGYETSSGRTHLPLLHSYRHCLQHCSKTKEAAQTLVQLCQSCLPLFQSAECSRWSVAAIGQQLLLLVSFRIIFSASVEPLSSVHHHEQRIPEPVCRGKNRISRTDKNPFSNEGSGVKTVSGRRTHLCWLVTLLLLFLFHQISLPLPLVSAYTNEADQQTPNHNNGANQSPPHHRHKTGGQKQTEIGLNITRILNAFFDSGYDKRVRPDYAGPPVEVGVTMHIISISSISAVQMDFTSDLYFRQAWRDSRLSFKPRPGIEALYVGAEVSEKIWVPDTFFANEKSAQFHVATTPNTFIRIKASGEVFRSMRLTVTSNCPMNLQYFPMDRQSCTIEIESYGYSMADIQYKWGIDGKNDVELAKNLELPQFKVNKHRQKQKVEVLSTGNYSRLVCEIEFVRSMGYYLIQIYIPASLIVIISWVSFWLHRNASPARVQLGVTTVLTMTTLMSSTNAAMPKISYIKSIDVFLGTCFVMVFAALLEYATVGYMGKRIAMRKTRTQQILKILNDHRERCIIAAANNEAAKEGGAAEGVGRGGYEGVNRSNSASGTGALIRTASLYQCQERADPEEGHSAHKRPDFRSSSTTGHACYQSSSTSYLGQAAAASSISRPLERSSSLKSRIFSDIDEQDPSGMNNFNDDLSVFVPATSSAADRGNQSTLQSQSPYYHYQSRNSVGDLYGRAGLSDRMYSGPSYVMKDHNTLFGVCPSDIDKYSRVVFPVCFLCFNLMYWVIYLHISEFLIDEQTSGNNPFTET